jgi:hypothetical protein
LRPALSLAQRLQRRPELAGGAHGGGGGRFSADLEYFRDILDSALSPLFLLKNMSWVAPIGIEQRITVASSGTGGLMQPISRFQ